MPAPQVCTTWDRGDQIDVVDVVLGCDESAQRFGTAKGDITEEWRHSAGKKGRRLLAVDVEVLF
jgi:hypothetical protein